MINILFKDIISWAFRQLWIGHVMFLFVWNLFIHHRWKKRYADIYPKQVNQ